jgi:hypothetical protein
MESGVYVGTANFRGLQMRVVIAESSHPEDFYNHELDGPATYQLLKLLGLSPELRYVLDRQRLRAAIQLATSQKTQIFHLSCHGDARGIELADGEEIGWSTLAGYFESGPYCPDALVMSACCGASSGIAKAFARKASRPKIIFGTTEERGYSQFAVAWAILYRRFKLSGVRREAARRALRDICAVAHPSFLYRRWDDDKGRYLIYPGEGVEYLATEKRKKKP